MHQPRSHGLFVLAAVALVALIVTFQPTSAQSSNDVEELRKGRNFIPTRVFTLEEDQQLLKLYEGLFVADVADGLDALGLQNIGSMTPDIMPLWKDFEHFRHRFVGIAVTVRYVPTNEPPAGKMESTQAYDRWSGNWYSRKSTEPFMPLIRPGTAVMIEDADRVDVGTIGSNNILDWVERGAVGVVTSTTARDTDEVAAQKIPLYLKAPGKGIRPGRNEVESVNRPIVVGGVLVEPGDVIVADGDGVICVPRDYAEAVAKYAKRILDERQAGRKASYERLGLPKDPSIKP
jgi:regulator of RNase E activity RraA